jgi:hypothetical protein
MFIALHQHETAFFGGSSFRVDFFFIFGLEVNE